MLRVTYHLRCALCAMPRVTDSSRCAYCKTVELEMTSRKEKIAVAMSGGVDSSVTAGLLLEQGYDVVGVTLRLWEGGGSSPRNCSDHRGAQEVSAFLGVPHRILDQRVAFQKAVASPFAADYAAGRTPNPCIACNRDFKLGSLMEWADSQGIERVATGHYARLERQEDRVTLWRGLDRKKDQSYFLFALSPDQLKRTVFPLGNLTKQQVRSKARELGLAVADRVESQDICFGNHRALVESLAKERMRGPGDIVDRTGRTLGRHEGIHGFTVGQRRGLGISASEPMYVCSIDAARNRVVVGRREELGSRGFTASEMNWIRQPAGDAWEAEVQIRYRSTSVPCIVRAGAAARAEVEFREVYPAVTPGQAAVFYRGEELLGGGWIDRALPQ